MHVISSNGTFLRWSQTRDVVGSQNRDPDSTRTTWLFDPTQHVYFNYFQSRVTKKSRPDPTMRPFWPNPRTPLAQTEDKCQFTILQSCMYTETVLDELFQKGLFDFSRFYSISFESTCCLAFVDWTFEFKDNMKLSDYHLKMLWLNEND